MGEKMIPLSQFHRDYLVAQGVLILPKSRTISKQVETREKENVPIVAMYERD